MQLTQDKEKRFLSKMLLLEGFFHIKQHKFVGVICNVALLVVIAVDGAKSDAFTIRIVNASDLAPSTAMVNK
jgi:hypothetical protein